MSLEVLTQLDVDNRLENVSQSVANFLSENDIDLGYNPQRRTFKNWYGREFCVDYLAKLGYFSGSSKLTSNKININVLRGAKLVPPRLLSDRKVVNTLLHEKIHQDIGIIETPLFYAGIITYAIQTENFIGIAGLTLGYIIAREIAVDVIKKFKYGKNLSGGSSHERS